MAHPETARPFVVSGNRRLMIGRCVLERERSGLMVGDSLIKLRPKAFQALECLATHENGVSREELAVEIWGPQAASGLQANPLDQIVSELRRALNAVREISIRRERNGYRLYADTTGPEAPAEQLKAGHTFPLEYLLDPTRWIAPGELLHSEFVIAALRPLETMPANAEATFRQLEAGVQLTVLLPDTQVECCPKLLSRLLLGASERLADELAGDELALEIKRRTAVVRKGLRISLIPDDPVTAVHTQVFHADEDRQAVAVVIPPESPQGFVYATGERAVGIAKAIKRKALGLHTSGGRVISIGESPASDKTQDALITAFYRYFGRGQATDSLIAQLW